MIETPSLEALMTAKEAAKKLSISDRTLWTLTNIGEIASVRIGRAVRYSMDDIQEFIRRNKTS